LGDVQNGHQMMGLGDWRMKNNTAAAGGQKHHVGRIEKIRGK
jgi:hypothetical protein